MRRIADIARTLLTAMWRGFARSVPGYGGLTPFHLLGLPPPPGTWHRLRGCSATGARDPLAEVSSRHDAEAMKALDAPGGAVQLATSRSSEA